MSTNDLGADGWVIIIGAVFLGVTQIVSIVLAHLREQAQVERDRLAAQAVKDVKNDLVGTGEITSHKLDDLKAVAKDTHTLVNSNMAVQLELNAAVSRRLANMTQDPEDAKAAELAERHVKDHEAKQKKVDDGAQPTKKSDPSLAGKIAEVGQKVDEVKTIADEIKDRVISP